jgi:hypothetical protein
MMVMKLRRRLRITHGERNYGLKAVGRRSGGGEVKAEFFDAMADSALADAQQFGDHPAVPVVSLQKAEELFGIRRPRLRIA